MMYDNVAWLFEYSGHWLANCLPMEGGVPSVLHITSSRFIRTTFNFYCAHLQRENRLSEQLEQEHFPPVNNTSHDNVVIVSVSQSVMASC